MASIVQRPWLDGQVLYSTGVVARITVSLRWPAQCPNTRVSGRYSSIPVMPVRAHGQWRTAATSRSRSFGTQPVAMRSIGWMPINLICLLFWSIPIRFVVLAKRWGVERMHAKPVCAHHDRLPHLAEYGLAEARFSLPKPTA